MRRCSTLGAQDSITRFWDLHAREYDADQVSQLHMGEARSAWLDVWRSALPAAPADVLEVGAGTGQVSWMLAELGHRVVGIDLAEGMLALARERCAGMANPPVLYLGDAVAPAFEPASFDVVVSRFVLWTLRETQRALANWRTLLRPGGMVVCVQTLRLAGSDDEHERLYDEQAVAALPLYRVGSLEPIITMFTAAGLESVRSAPLPEIQRWDRTVNRFRPSFVISGRAPAE